jgi:ribosomal protein S18 acetylase RimI-like enzyme
MEIESFRIDEYDQLLSLWERTGLSYDRADRDSRESIERQIFDDHVAILTLKDKGRIVGSIIASCDGRKGWINRLAVDPDYRGRRLAARLVEKAEEALSEMEVKVIAALVEDNNFSSMAAFRHCGYEAWSEVVYFRKILK